jgi:protein involved in polysaccharide export with SLBB domain
MSRSLALLKPKHFHFRGLSLAFCLVALVCGASAQEYGEVGEARPYGGGMSAPTERATAASKASAPTLNADAAAFAAVDESTYVVGPGDILYIALGSRSLYAPVGPDGNVIIESFPPISVDRKTLVAAKRAVMENLSRFYKGGAIYIALAGAKKFQVSITGSINVPGLYTMEPGARLLNLIAAAGGASIHSSFKVTIHRASGESIEIDRGDYFITNDVNKDPLLVQGDQVFLHEFDYGEPLIYLRDGASFKPLQIDPGETVAQLLAKADGFSNPRPWDYIDVYKDDIFAKRILRSEAATYVPEAGVTLDVGLTKGVVFVRGTVISPGMVPYNASFTVYDYMALAGVTTNTGNLEHVDVRDARGKTRKVDPARGTLLPGDHILVPRSFEAKTRDYVGLVVSISSLAVAIATFIVITQ